MKRTKYLVVCLSAVLFGSLILTSCSNKKGSGVDGKLEITDVRIGTGESNINIGTVVFNADEKIILTFDVKNITSITDSGLGKEDTANYWIREDLTVRDMNGSVVILKPGIIDEKQPIYAKPMKFKNRLSLPGVGGIKPGKYIVSLLVTDLIGFQTATTEIPIRIE